MTVSLITFAQEVESDAVNSYKNIKQSNENDKSVSVIWSEDFGNGFPANWTRYTSAGNATCNWVWSDDGSWGNFSGGGTSSADAALNSTTSCTACTACDAKPFGLLLASDGESIIETTLFLLKDQLVSLFILNICSTLIIILLMRETRVFLVDFSLYRKL